jgi:hypothetical protein
VSMVRIQQKEGYWSLQRDPWHSSNERHIMEPKTRGMQWGACSPESLVKAAEIARLSGSNICSNNTHYTRRFGDLIR